jgi:hypothetical protein
MSDSLFNVIERVAVVALIVGVIRWLVSAKGAQGPSTRAGVTLYKTKWQLRATGVIVACSFSALPIWLRHDPDWPFLLIFTALGLACLWLTIGSVVTDPSGITMRFFGYSRSLGWGEITAVQLDKRTGVIVLLAGAKKLAIDSRFAATQLLLNDIVGQTELQPSAK